jgi:hypothetical protein
LQLNAVVYVGDGRSREVIRAFEFGGNFAMPGCNVSAGANRSRLYSFEVLRSPSAAILNEPAILAPVRVCSSSVHQLLYHAGMKDGSKCDRACCAYCASVNMLTHISHSLP